MEKKIKSFSALTIFIIIIATITALCITGSKDLSSVKDVKMTKNSINSISLSWKEVKKQMATMFITLIITLTSMLSSVKARAMKIANLR